MDAFLVKLGFFVEPPQLDLAFFHLVVDCAGVG